MFGKISYFILCLYIGVNFAMELENIKQDDVKYEAKEKHFETELLDLEEVPELPTARDSTETNEDKCCSEVEVIFFQKENGQGMDKKVWKEHTGIFGVYKKDGNRNGKPQYTMQEGKYGIWQSSQGSGRKFVIGLTSNRGRKDGLAINDNVDAKNCPYQPTFDWHYKDVAGEMRAANHGLTVKCITHVDE